MDRLATNMEAITEFSGRISSTLQDRRQQIQKLAGVHSLLKKVQIITIFYNAVEIITCIHVDTLDVSVTLILTFCFYSSVCTVCQ